MLVIAIILAKVESQLFQHYICPHFQTLVGIYDAQSLSFLFLHYSFLFLHYIITVNDIFILIKMLSIYIKHFHYKFNANGNSFTELSLTKRSMDVHTAQSMRLPLLMFHAQHLPLTQTQTVTQNIIAPLHKPKGIFYFIVSV